MADPSNEPSTRPRPRSTLASGAASGRARLARGFASALLAASLFACGPRHLSALGNPGDLCTEQSACIEGTDCRITEEGYRCVGRDGRLPPGASGPGERTAVEDEPPPGFRPVAGEDEDGSME